MEKQEKIAYEEAIVWVKDYMSRKKLSQSAMAKVLDISAGGLSSYLSGKYPSHERITEKVLEVIELHQKKVLEPQAPNYAETTVTRLVIQAIGIAHMRGVVSVAYGDAGVGKSTAVNQYLKENQLAIGITIMPTYASLTGVNELLAEVLGIRERTDRKITREIVEKLRGSGRVIIVDEAQHLTIRAIEHLRSICDASRIGVCFVGNETIYTKLIGSHKSEFAQLYSRISMRKMVTVDTNCREDIYNIFAGYDLDASILDLLYRISRTGYGLRGAVNAFVNTIGVFEDLTLENLTKVVRDMNIAS